MRVLVAGTFDPEFARNRIVLSLLARVGVEVDVVHRSLWGNDRYKLVEAPKARLALKALRVYASLILALLRARRPDAVVVLYPGHFDMPVVALVARLRGIPVMFDPFISLNDTVVGDRALRRESSLAGRLTRLVDRVACRSARLVLADTPAHADYLAELTGVPRTRFRVQWVGAQAEVFHPQDDVRPHPRLVLFYGTFIPLHGIDTIVRAAKALEDDDIRIRIVGDGQERSTIERLVAELSVTNLELHSPVALERLPREIAAASLCLGIFGTSPKAGRVIPNKVFQCLAVGRPILTADTAAIRSAFAGEVAVVPAGDPQALATTIRTLLDDEVRLAGLADAGRERFDQDYSEPALARLLAGYLDELVSVSRPVGGR